MIHLRLIILGASLAVLVQGILAQKAPEPKKTEKNEAVKVEPADNSYCLVCHRNYEKEELTAIHTPKGIGCEKCHGISERHSSDEDGITPPEIMYSRAKINPSCLKCHVEKKLKEAELHDDILKFIASKKPVNEKSPLCTDCHGTGHHMKHRTRIWDKDTGKLMSDDGVRMMDKSRPSTKK